MADHAKKSTTNTTLTTERIKAITLLIVQLYSVIQTGLTLAGISELPFASDEVSAGITGAIAVLSSIYAWWRNNNVTKAALAGQALTNSIKNGQVAATQGTSLPDGMTTIVEHDDAETVELDAITGTPIIEV